MDRSRTPGDDDRRPTAALIEQAHLRVCLDRTIELAEVRLRLRDWPGFAGPIVHVPDPLVPDDSLVDALADLLAPRYRVLSIEPGAGNPYQVHAAELLAALDQFGFETPVLVAEGLGCIAALLVAAWHSKRMAGLVMIEPFYDPPPSEALETRAIRDCPPDWAALREAVQCPVLEVPRDTATVDRVVAFFDQFAPVDVT